VFAELNYAIGKNRPMSTILYRGVPLQTPFGLLGHNEPGMTNSLGWVLGRSTEFLTAFIARATGRRWQRPVLADAEVRLQQFNDEFGGFTDVEVLVPGRLQLIVEAKVGWRVPEQAQLEHYRPRFIGEPVQGFIVLTEANDAYVRGVGLTADVQGIPLVVMRWRDLFGVLAEARPSGSNWEKRLLDDLEVYLMSTVKMQRDDSNLVYVVSLSGESISRVEHERLYSHPKKGSWPKEPPNYMGFRYGGRLRSIHHVDGYEVVRRNSGPDAGESFRYQLGPPIVPAHELGMGTIVRDTRIWAMIDTLLTCDTLSDARDLSHQRMASARV
jgi:hypothetical protein